MLTIWLDFNVRFVHWIEQNLCHLLRKGGVRNAIVRVLLNPAGRQSHTGVLTTDLEKH